ncbi:hypothetical protein ACFO4E_27710 [Nocardiopsis mangrovi]|uniref:Uncharacterized protein n=1 Tax=Nocardiopsis mangrovi TaxID=1179818 RepID=A0ABV9E4V6_9ACTN
MKALLWIVLVIAVAANVSANFTAGGVAQLAVSGATGLVVLASAGGLVLLRERRSCA